MASQPTDASKKLTSKLVLKPGQNVQFYMPDSEEHSLHQAMIVSRAGKSTGKYCNWYNIQFALLESKSGQATALDLGNVLELTVVEGSNSSSEMHNVSQLDENSRTSSVSTVSPGDEVQEVMLTLCVRRARYSTELQLPCPTAGGIFHPRTYESSFANFARERNITAQHTRAH